jgi:hypothetical protein
LGALHRGHAKRNVWYTRCAWESLESVRCSQRAGDQRSEIRDQKSEITAAIMLPETCYTLDVLNDAKHAAPDGAFGLLMNDGYRSLTSDLSPSRRLYGAGG